jgi:hypothetical protein
MNTSEIIEIRALKNPIARTYADNKMIERHAAVAALFPALSTAIPKKIPYTDDMARRYPA